MKVNLELEARIVLKPLVIEDFEFIKTLVNTDGWIKFIGQRNINNNEDSKEYINKILANENVKYWVVHLIETNTAIGIITFIKRDYLELHDLGFAFLPEFSCNGFAFEGSNLIIKSLKTDRYKQILATTIPENQKSIKLLEKLGFLFDKEIENNNEILHVYTKKIN